MIYKAYQQICKSIDTDPIPKEIFRELCPKEIPGSTLVAVPNWTFEKKVLYKLAADFGKDQPYKTYIIKEFYDQYTDEELCGKATGDLVRFVHIPQTYNVLSDNVANQKANNSGHVPTVLEAICFWYTLREAGSSLNFDSTNIRHFDLEQKAVGGWSHVPLSYVNRVGLPNLGISAADARHGARLAVGENLEPLALSSAVPFSSAPIPGLQGMIDETRAYLSFLESHKRHEDD